MPFEPYFADDGAIKIIDRQHIHGIVTSNKLILNRTEIEKYPTLQWIARLGSGMEIIDTDYCDQHGIRYVSSPAGIANSVAEHVTGMLLSLLHHIDRSSREIRSQLWLRESNRGTELQDMCVGIIGYGHTGQAVVQKLSAFTSSILVYDKYKSNFSQGIIQEVSLSELQEKADIVSFHVPLNEETKHFYKPSFAAAMKKDHILINASRGAVADTQAIRSALESGKLKGACLDVLEEEKGMPGLLQAEGNIVANLLTYPVIITPHIAGYSHNAIRKMCDELMVKLMTIL